MSAGVTPLSRGAGECPDSPAARRTEGPPQSVPGPRRTPRCGVGRCSRLGPVLRDGSFSPPPPSSRPLRARCPFRSFLFARVPSGPVLPLASRQGRVVPPQRLPSGMGPPRRPPRVRPPVPLHFHLGPSPFSSLSLRIGNTPSPFSSPQDWVLSLRPPSPQGRSFLPPPGAGGSLHLRAPPLCHSAAPRGTRGQALLSGSSLRLSPVPGSGVGGNLSWGEEGKRLFSSDPCSVWEHSVLLGHLDISGICCGSRCRKETPSTAVLGAEGSV